MSEQQSEHLSHAQIEDYGDRTSGAEPDQDQRSKDQRVEAHLDDCPSCRARVLDFQRTRLAPQADPQVKQASTPDCPSEDDLRQLAAGLCTEAVATRLTHHAATCDHCGPLLRAYTEDFSDDFTAEEQAILASLQSSSASWQKETARKMLDAAEASAAGDLSAAEVDSAGLVAAADVKADTVKSASDTSADKPAASDLPADKPADTAPTTRSSAKLGRKPFFWKWLLVPATAAALAAITVPVYLAQRDTPEKIEKTLAQAYTENRKMEMRIPYAKHSELHQLRSSDRTSLLQLPGSIHKAAEAITAQLKANPDDPEWLLLSARLDLLDRQYESALATLAKIEPKNASQQSEIEMARALALYQRAEFESDQPEAYGQAVEILAKVLQQTPDDPVALYNQAVACEKAHMYECASADLDHLLRVEQDPGWSREAREHLERVQGKKNLAPKR